MTKTKSSHKSHLLALAGYLLLTIAMTWPAMRHFTTGIPGDGFDGWQNYWNLWWVKQALLVLGSNPYFTHLLDAPTGVSLLFHTLNIFNGLWTLPLQLNFGLAAAYNSVVLLSFVLAGFGGYLLSLYTLGQILPRRPGLRAAAFVGGLIFTMSPFHMAHLLGHMQVFSMIWPPFYILWLLRTLRPWATPGDAPPPRQWRDAALSCLFLVLATLVDLYHTLYLLMFTGVALLWLLWRNRRFISRRPWRDNPLLRPLLVVAAIGAGFGVALSPLLLPLVRNASQRPDLDTGLRQNITLSADLLAFVLPSEMHPLWGEWAAGIASNFTSTTSERLVFAGFVPLVLGLLALLRGWRWAAVKFWALIGGVFVLMALGPFLHINGQVVSLGGWQLPLPYLALYYTVPFINLTRSLSRYDLMVMLSLGVLASVGLALLSRRTRRGLLLPGTAALLICIEFLPAPYPVSLIDIPQFYYDLAADPAGFTIAELPMNWDRPTPMLHQTVHGKPLLTAYTSRDNPQRLAWRTPVFQQWQNLGPDIIDQPLADIAPTIFYDFNLRYIVLDFWQMPPGPERDATEQWVAAALPNAVPVVDDGRLKVYQSPPKTETRPYLSLGDGWSQPQSAAAGRAVNRTFTGQSELYLHHPPGQPLELTISATSAAPVTVSVSGEGGPLGSFEVTPHSQTATLPLPAATGDLLKLRLQTATPGDTVAVSRVALAETEP